MNFIHKLRTNYGLRMLASKVYSLIGCNSSKLKGKNNQLVTKGTFRRHCKFRVYGDNNRIVFAESIYGICNVMINIFGNNNLIQIGKNFATDGLCFSIEDDNNKIILGENCHGGKIQNWLLLKVRILYWVAIACCLLILRSEQEIVIVC